MEEDRVVTYETGCMYCGGFVGHGKMSRRTVRDLKIRYNDAVCPDCLDKERKKVSARRPK